jgi:hypothetical protein
MRAVNLRDVISASSFRISGSWTAISRSISACRAELAFQRPPCPVPDRSRGILCPISAGLQLEAA